MKPRKWIIAVCFLVLVLAGGLYVGKVSLEKNRNIERLLVQHISPAVGGTFAVDKVRIGFFSADLKGVKIVIPLQSFALKVQDIKIGFSFFKLIASRGDIRKSINKIILINPLLEVAFPNQGKDKTTTSVPRKSFSITEFPVEHLLVKNCAIQLIDKGGDSISVGEQLTGRIWGEGHILNFELRGKLAARRRNLFVTGVFAQDKNTQHVSIRLDKASIDKPIRWHTVSVVKGKLDGVCEFSFSDTTFPHNIDAHGMITIENGIGTIEGVAQKISDVHLKVSLAGNRVTFDTVAAQWNKITALCHGSTGFSSEQESRFVARFSGIDPQIVSGLPESMKSSLSGYGWVEMDARKKRNAQKFNADITAGGFIIGEKAIQRIAGKGSFDRVSATIDTVFCEYPGLSIGAAGLFNFEKSPVAYSFSLGLSGKAETFVPGCCGTFTATGDIHGLGNDPLITLLLQGNAITYSNLSLGNPKFSLIKRKESIHINSKQTYGDMFSLNGTIDSITKEQPRVNFKAQVYKPIITRLLPNFPGASKQTLDSALFTASITGNVPNPEIDGTLRLKGKKLDADYLVRFFRNDESMPYTWQFNGEDMYIADTLFPVVASGEIQGDSIRIRSLVAVEGITASGSIVTGEKGTADIAVSCKDVPLDKMNLLFSRDERLIQKGFINGSIRITGDFSQLKTSSQLNIRQFNIAGITSLETDAVIRSCGKEFTVLPFVIRKNKRMICKVDTVTNREHLSFSGVFNNIDIAHLLGTIIPPEYSLKGIVEGEFSTSPTGMPVQVNLYSQRISLNTWNFDSVNAHIKMAQKSMIIEELTATDSSRSSLSAGGIIPWSFLTNEIKEQDTLHFSAKVEGDLLATLEHNYESNVGGTGQGEILVDFSVTSEQWNFHKAYARIPKGVLTVDPFIPDKVKDFMFVMKMDKSSRLHVTCGGYVDKRPISVTNTHIVPKGFEPLLFGSLNCGVLQVRTPKNGIPLFILGFMERGNRGDIEFAPRKPFDAFSLSGPLERLRITGTWVLRNIEFTFPLLEDAPLPQYIMWDLDLRAGNRKVMYFYNIGRKRRRLLRFTECYIDPPSTLVKIRDREIDGSFKILGKIRAYRGYVFYGRNFDRDYDLGIDFAPQKMEDGSAYDNLPIIWGSAEAFSDSSRFDRIKLTLLVRDTKTGSLSEKGRFSDITFRVSSDFEEIPGEAELEFYKEAGLNFITFKQAGRKAGEMMSSLGDQYINRYFLQRIERKLARRLGLDVISFETSIASNYFNYLYNNQNQFGDLAQQWDYLAFANVGVTLGRYVLRDKIFLKWRTELIPKDFLLTPEHNIGFEYQPLDYFWVDFNYGFFRNEADIMESNPKLRMQLRLPITKLRNFFDF